MKPEWALRIVADHDLAISDGALRLLNRILSHRVYHCAKRQEPIWEMFPITWAMVAIWCGCGERESYNRLGELCSRGYLKHEGVFGQPGQAHYRLVEAMADGPPFKNRVGRAAQLCSPRTAQERSARAARKDRPSSAQERSARAARKGGDHILYSLREEKSTQKGSNSSLRSTGTKGDLIAASPTGNKLTKAEQRRLWDAAKAKAAQEGT